MGDRFVFCLHPDPSLSGGQSWVGGRIRGKLGCFFVCSPYRNPLPAGGADFRGRAIVSRRFQFPKRWRSSL
jgi:hypothetical protein